MQFSLISCYFIFLRFKYSLRILFPNTLPFPSERPGFIPIWNHLRNYSFIYSTKLVYFNPIHLTWDPKFSQSVHRHKHWLLMKVLRFSRVHTLSLRNIIIGLLESNWKPLRRLFKDELIWVLKWFIGTGQLNTREYRLYNGWSESNFRELLPMLQRSSYAIITPYWKDKFFITVNICNIVSRQMPWPV